MCRDRLRIKTEEHPIMLAEPTFNPREARERTLEVRPRFARVGDLIQVIRFRSGFQG